MHVCAYMYLCFHTSAYVCGSDRIYATVTEAISVCVFVWSIVAVCVCVRMRNVAVDVEFIGSENAGWPCLHAACLMGSGATENVG